MHGEREEAHKKVTKDWLDHGYIERPTPVMEEGKFSGNWESENSGKGQNFRPNHRNYNCEWLSQTFVVPKKSVDFSWRGVVDMRGPNSQSRRLNYPLPRIEDLLVKQGGNRFFNFRFEASFSSAAPTS